MKNVLCYGLNGQFNDDFTAWWQCCCYDQPRLALCPESLAALGFISVRGHKKGSSPLNALLCLTPASQSHGNTQ